MGRLVTSTSGCWAPPAPALLLAGLLAFHLPAARAQAGAATVAAAGPAWSDLDVRQQQALAPLAATWPSLSETQKRNWMTLSGNFHRLSAAEQATLQGRMRDWAALSSQQRAQARLNFGEVRNLQPSDKQAQWEAYQALPPEEKRRLAQEARARAAAHAAPAVQPAPPGRLATVP